MNTFFLALADSHDHKYIIVSRTEAHLTVNDHFQELDVDVGRIDVLKRFGAGLLEVVDV